MRIIAGTLKNRTIVTPKGHLTRPTSAKLREAVFNICQNMIEGAHFLDLFAGSGAMGIEAISRGASSAAFVDQSGDAISCILKNLESLKIKDKAQVLRGDIWKMLEKLVKQGNSFQIVYVDPPYAFGGQAHFWERLGGVFAETQLLENEGWLFFEQGKDVSASILECSKLQLVSSRRAGAATLLQFQKKGA